jgi:hypothetical protein
MGRAHDTTGAVPTMRIPPAPSPDDRAMVFAAAAPLLCHPLERTRGNTLEATIYPTGRLLVVNRTSLN